MTLLQQTVPCISSLNPFNPETILGVVHVGNCCREKPGLSETSGDSEMRASRRPTMRGLDASNNPHPAHSFHVSGSKDLSVFNSQSQRVEGIRCGMCVCRVAEVTQNLFVCIDYQRVSTVSNRMRVHLESSLDPPLNQGKKGRPWSAQHSPR